jgi:threonine/homoserine/homoserine lactone efflux protein
MIYPLFLNSEQGYLSQAVILSLTAMVISFSIYAGYSLAASALKKRLAAKTLGSRMSANKLVGSVYLAAAGALASK